MNLIQKIQEQDGNTIVNFFKQECKKSEGRLALGVMMAANQTLEESWEDKEPAPLEFFHAELMNGFHAWRKETVGSATEIAINGTVLNELIRVAKIKTYEKYPKQINRNAVKITDM